MLSKHIQEKNRTQSLPIKLKTISKPAAKTYSSINSRLSHDEKKVDPYDDAETKMDSLTSALLPQKEDQTDDYQPKSRVIYNVSYAATIFFGGIPAIVGECTFGLFSYKYAELGTKLAIASLGEDPTLTSADYFAKLIGYVAAGSEIVNGVTQFTVDSIPQTAQALDTLIGEIRQNGIGLKLCYLVKESFKDLKTSARSLYFGTSYGLFMFASTVTAYGDIEDVKDRVQDWLGKTGGNAALAWLGTGAIFYCVKSFLKSTEAGMEFLLHPTFRSRNQNHRNLWIEWQYLFEGGIAIIYRSATLSFLLGRLGEQWELDNIPLYYTFGGIAGFSQGVQLFLRSSHKKIHRYVDVEEEYNVCLATENPTQGTLYVSKNNGSLTYTVITWDGSEIKDVLIDSTIPVPLSLTEDSLSKIKNQILTFAKNQNHTPPMQPITQEERNLAWNEYYGTMNLKQKIWDEFKRSFLIGIAQSGATAYFYINQVMPILLDKLKESHCPEEIAYGVSMLIGVGATILCYIPHRETSKYVTCNQLAFQNRQKTFLTGITVGKDHAIKENKSTQKQNPCAKFTGTAASLMSQVTRVPALIASLINNKKINPLLSNSNWTIFGGSIGTLVGYNRYHTMTLPSINGIHSFSEVMLTPFRKAKNWCRGTKTEIDKISIFRKNETPNEFKALLESQKLFWASHRRG